MKEKSKVRLRRTDFEESIEENNNTNVIPDPFASSRTAWGSAVGSFRPLRTTGPAGKASAHTLHDQHCVLE